ncbi:MAG TPA: thiol:disulfide interchange protein DsbG [Gammaproteobacteria bacterium]|jgi:thiol:disulfide interchange protein DsbG|nr:thiol:disulfide interchange protein DsbG [Gammaproteobacteria bacterium]
MLKSKWNSRSFFSLTALLMLLVSATSYAAPPLWLKLRHTPSVGEGTKHPQHLFYVITDANCPYCHELWAELQPYYNQGLRVRYVMVGILADNSPGKAAAILEARHPAAALDRNERDWQRLPDDMGGGIPPLAKPKAKTLALLKSDEQLMHDLGVQGTPALIYIDSHGAMQIIQSVPDPTALAGIVHDAAAK